MRNILFEKLKELNLPIGKYAVFGSGPMCIRRIRENRDIDVIVTKDIFEMYKKNPDWELKRCNKSDYLENKNFEIELWEDWAPGEWNVEDLINDSEIINDLPFVKLEYVKEWKKIHGREKDLKDVEKN